MEVGTYGIIAKEHPGGGTPLQGPTDRYTDVAADVQYQFIGEDHLFTALSTYIDERQKLEASVIDAFAQNASNNLKTFKLAGEYYYRRAIGGSLGFFNTSGSSDVLLYPQAVVVGSVVNNPNTRGYVGEINYLPWLNAKLQLQYVRYAKFNGLSNNYDGSGRNASGNDTLYLLGWINY